MKKVVSFFLILLLLLPQLTKFLYLVYWKLNQTAIISLYCENKENPDMHCNGKCHLEKQINKIDSGQNRDTKSTPSDWKRIFESENLYFFTEITFSSYSNYIISQYDRFIGYLEQIYSLKIIKSIFRPPNN